MTRDELIHIINGILTSLSIIIQFTFKTNFIVVFFCTLAINMITQFLLNELPMTFDNLKFVFWVSLLFVLLCAMILLYENEYVILIATIIKGLIPYITSIYASCAKSLYYE